MIKEGCLIVFVGSQGTAAGNSKAEAVLCGKGDVDDSGKSTENPVPDHEPAKTSVMASEKEEFASAAPDNHPQVREGWCVLILFCFVI